MPISTISGTRIRRMTRKIAADACAVEPAAMRRTARRCRRSSLRGGAPPTAGGFLTVSPSPCPSSPCPSSPAVGRHPLDDQQPPPDGGGPERATRQGGGGRRPAPPAPRGG